MTSPNGPRSNYLPGSAGYFKVARQQAVRDPWKFLADYPQWIRDQDSLHIGTHPPGLIAVQCVLIGVMERQPALAGFLLDHMPAAVEQGFRVFAERDPHPLTRADRAALYATALLTLLACAGTVVPLYLLARVALPRTGGLGGGGALAAGPGRQPVPAGRRHGLPLALDVRPGAGCLGRAVANATWLACVRRHPAGDRFGNGDGTSACSSLSRFSRSGSSSHWLFASSVPLHGGHEPY